MFRKEHRPLKTKKPKELSHTNLRRHWGCNTSVEGRYTAAGFSPR